MKTDEWFENNKVISIGSLFLLILCFIIYAAICDSGNSFSHDPEKMLELRKECLATDPNIMTTYCDEFAEKYSRKP